jgi:hypothetical protein
MRRDRIKPVVPVRAAYQAQATDRTVNATSGQILNPDVFAAWF